jgi:hypothetical protein
VVAALSIPEFAGLFVTAISLLIFSTIALFRP